MDFYRPAFSSSHPFHLFLSTLLGQHAYLERDLEEAMRARHDWREAVENMSTDRLREVLERSESLNDYADVQMARMSEGRWLSNLRSAGILVVLQANLEDLRRRVVGNMKAHFGPRFNDVPFSALLHAGANSCRHGAEWWNRATIASLEQIRKEQAGLDVDDEGVAWNDQQLQSIDTIVAALGKSRDEVSNQVAIDVLAALSDEGDMALLVSRLIDTATEMADVHGRRADLQHAIRRLGI
jgi:hypothetical protein